MENNYNHFENIFKRDEAEINRLINSLSINLLEGFFNYIYEKVKEEYTNELNLNTINKAVSIMNTIIKKIVTHEKINYIEASSQDLINKYQTLLNLKSVVEEFEKGTKTSVR